MNSMSTWGGFMVATKEKTLDFSTPESPENTFSGIFTYLVISLKIFFSIYFTKPTINHYKNMLLTWTYSVFFALPILVMQLKHQKMKVTSSFGILIVIHIGTFTKNWKFGHVSLKTRDFEIKWEVGRQPLKREVSHSKQEGWNIYLIDVKCCIGPPMIQYNLEKIYKTYPPRCPKNTFPGVFYIKLSKLVSNHWHRLWHCYIFLCSMFSIFTWCNKCDLSALCLYSTL